MSLDADHIVDRRRMRRKLTFWRVVTVLLVVATVIGGTLALSRGRTGLSDGTAGAIARVNIEGLIRSNRERTEALERLGKSSAKAVIVRINSPGGTVTGSEQLYDSIAKLKTEKPVVVVVEGLAASGGYIAAMAADHIIAQQSSIVGSIGVLFQYPNFSELLKTVGVQVESIKSSPLKASPNGLEPTSPEARAAVEALVLDSYGWFKRLVAERRKLEGAELDRVSDGRVFTGRQSLELKLIDQIGNEQTAIGWLATEKQIDPKTPVRDYRLQPRLGDLSFLRILATTAFDAVGLSAVARQVGDWGALQAMERLNLDGLLALWHPPASN